MSSSKAFLAIASVVFLILSASAAPAAEAGERLETSASSYYGGFGYPYLGGGYPYIGSAYSLGYPYSYSYGHYGGYPRSYGYGLHGGYW